MHSASLIIDDMPAFDNDEERRGSPTVHAATTPAVAQMAALTLLSTAFQNICRQIDWIRDNCPEFKNVDRIGTKLCHDVSRAMGVFGAAGGQYMDVSATDTLFAEYGPGAVMEIMYRKTATFFEVAVLAGWLIAGGDSEHVDDARSIGRHIGIAFQIADDIGDMERDADRRAKGKPGWNLANEIGREEAAREVERNLRAARLNLERLRLWSKVWEEIMAKVREMMVTLPASNSTQLPATAGKSDGDARGPAGVERGGVSEHALTPVHVFPEESGAPDRSPSPSGASEQGVDGDQALHEAIVGPYDGSDTREVSQGGLQIHPPVDH